VAGLSPQDTDPFFFYSQEPQEKPVWSHPTSKQLLSSPRFQIGVRLVKRVALELVVLAEERAK
jgi:hypothetical protein